MPTQGRLLGALRPVILIVAAAIAVGLVFTTSSLQTHAAKHEDGSLSVMGLYHRAYVALSVRAPSTRRCFWLESLTGRTHQLRVHLAHVGCPLLGDRAYGGASRIVLDNGSVVSARRVMLHCFALSLPAQGGEPERAFERLPPDDFTRIFAALSAESLPELLRAQLRVQVRAPRE